MPLYCFLISKGYRTHPFPPLFYHKIFTGHDQVTPAREQEILDALASTRYPDFYVRESGLIVFPESHGNLSHDLAEIPAHRLRSPHVRFFLSRNPRFAEGHALACLAEISAENMRSYASPTLSLTSDRVLLVVKTSGSSDDAKSVPYAASLRAAFRAAIGGWMCHLSWHHPKLITGNAYGSLTPLARRKEHTRGGLPVGFESDAEYFGSGQRKLLNTLMAVPNETARISELTECLYVTLRFLLQSQSLAFVAF